ncbi:MAG: threonine--tRNA ligase [Firmicutes bacterium]|nr:threonine--tRNA ligase [Bacillota bacterium]
MIIRFPDDQELNFESGVLAVTALKAWDKECAKSAVGVKINGEMRALTTPLNDNDTLLPLSFTEQEGRQMFWHSSSHIMAQAVQHLFPGTRFGIGPSIKEGFYYDFDSEHVFTPEDLIAIEQEIKRIVKKNEKYLREELSREQALQLFTELGENYKVELINDLPKDAVISVYRQGDFLDLCAGPHLTSTGAVKAVKLLSLAGAYWRGSEKNKMLQRIYAISFPEQRQLDEYITKLEEAKKRDHRKLGTELELFMMTDDGPGFPFFLPKGMIIRNELEQYWRQQHRMHGYQEIKTPIILNRDLWEQSGHWDHYKNNMYFTQIDEATYAVKPMNCPGGLLVYKNKPHSYRELPIRVGELGLVHRHELSGVLHGLMRVRCFTQDDAHLFMMEEQVKDEIKGVARLIDDFYKLFGFSYHVELSTRPEKAMGSVEVWNEATKALAEAMDEMGMPYTINEGDGAFYGPKLDFHLQDSLNRTWQCGTIQLDFQMPERFDLNYIGSDNQPHRPVMIHRVLFGSIERFIGILIEHYAGAFPLWLSPVQAKVLTITDRQNDYAAQILLRLEEMGIRTELDTRNEKIGYKIRAAQTEKIPYLLVLGDKEQEQQTAALRKRGEGDLGAFPVEDIVARLLKEIQLKV